ncbi:MAG: hypothetical protein OXM55_03790 [Bdellovibrionales bacterium]|nr:hypothetical protein [Bdellovibrionales bacterium]
MKFTGFKKIFCGFSLLLFFLCNIIELFACEESFLPGTIAFSLRVQNGGIAALTHTIQSHLEKSTGYYSRGEVKIGLIDYQLALEGDRQMAAQLDMRFPIYDEDGHTYYMRKGEPPPFPLNNTENYENAVRSAIEDFNKAIEIHPYFYQDVSRRGEHQRCRDNTIKQMS